LPRLMPAPAPDASIRRKLSCVLNSSEWPPHAHGCNCSFFSRVYIGSRRATDLSGMRILELRSTLDCGFGLHVRRHAYGRGLSRMTFAECTRTWSESMWTHVCKNVGCTCTAPSSWPAASARDRYQAVAIFKFRGTMASCIRWVPAPARERIHVRVPIH